MDPPPGGSSDSNVIQGLLDATIVSVSELPDGRCAAHPATTAEFPVTQDVEATGNVTPLGGATWQSSHCFQPMTGDVRDGFGTLTDASGDALEFDYTFAFVVLERGAGGEPLSGVIEGTLALTGGTGRFQTA